MKTIIAGSRDIEDLQIVLDAIEASGFEITEVVSGTARGVDTLGIDYAISVGLPYKKFPAKWTVDGIYRPQAGILRNIEMACYAEALIAIWDGVSKGTLHMINIAKKKGLKVYVHQIIRKTNG